jgi:hypothetical protein
MNWYEISLTKGQIEEGVLAILQNDFRRLWQLVGEREDMALFVETHQGQRNGQRCFISPGSLPWAESIISHYFASPCDPPEKSKVTLEILIGHPEAEELIE